MIVATNPERPAEELDNADLFEIIDGVKVGLPPMSANSSVFASRLARLVSNYAADRGLGEAHPEILFKLPLDRDRNRRPDVAYVPYSKWPKDRPIPDENAWAVFPDLFVEVVSPSDRGEEAREKVEEYLEAGAPLIWVVYPRIQIVEVIEQPGVSRSLRRGDVLTGGSVIPGFELKLADLFPEPPPNRSAPAT